MPETVLDNVVPGERWEFDAAVAASFDDMLARSIPEYGKMRELVRRIGFDILHRAPGHQPMPDRFGGNEEPEPRFKTIVDLGSSRGESITAFVELAEEAVTRNGAIRYDVVANEVSRPMLEVLRNRWGSSSVVRISEADITQRFPETGFVDLVLSVLTLQFTPINYRQKIVEDVFSHLRVGGGFVLVEKVLGEGAELDRMLVGGYHAMKLDNGYSYDDIDRKRASLEGVLVPVTAAWNEDLLRRAGFRHVDCIWRYLNFAAWAALK